MYNAFQPGVFALSGWDLVGALPLPAEAVAPLLADGDTRWIQRGAYDLMGVNPAADASQAGLPRAQALYGSLPDQLGRPDSFVSQLRRLLEVRRACRLYAARQIDVPAVQTPGLLVMVHELPDELGFQVTALNFGATGVDEPVRLAGVPPGLAVDMVGAAAGKQLRRMVCCGCNWTHTPGSHFTCVDRRLRTPAPQRCSPLPTSPTRLAGKGGSEPPIPAPPPPNAGGTALRFPPILGCAQPLPPRIWGQGGQHQW